MTEHALIVGAALSVVVGLAACRKDAVSRVDPAPAAASAPSTTELVTVCVKKGESPTCPSYDGGQPSCADGKVTQVERGSMLDVGCGR